MNRRLHPTAVPPVTIVREALAVLHIVDAEEVPFPGVAVLVAAVLVDSCGRFGSVQADGIPPDA